MARKPVNARQLEVLRWVAAGCPEGVMTNFSYKTTAVALRNRRLLKVSKRGGWRAELTDDGRYYLAHGAYPDVPSGPAPPSRAKREEEPRPQEPADAVRVEDAPPSALESPSVPVEKPKIVVPESLRKPHPVIAELRDSKRDLDLTASVRGRALRVLHALAKEAEARGYTVEPVKKHHEPYGRVSYDSRDHLIIDTGEVREGVRIVQLTDKTPHVLTAREIKEADDRWARTPPKYDHTPNVYLRVELDQSWGSSRYRWSEGPRGPIDRKLPAVLGEIEQRHERAKERRLKAEAERLERERQWQVAHDRATALLQEHHRAEVLLKQADDWQRAGQLRAYVESMRQKTEALATDEERLAAVEWVEWASRFAESLDPLNREIAMPADVEAGPEALQRFMGGWSAYGLRR